MNEKVSLSDFPRCDVMRHSRVQEHTTKPVQFKGNDECKAKATYVLLETSYGEDEDPGGCCDAHYEGWQAVVAADSDITFIVLAGLKPVSDDDVQAAIASILTAVR